MDSEIRRTNQSAFRKKKLKHTGDGNETNWFVGARGLIDKNIPKMSAIKIGVKTTSSGYASRCEQRADYDAELMQIF